MGARVLELEAIGAHEEERWRELAADALEPNAFFEPDFVLPALRLTEHRPERLVVIDGGRRWLACAPVARTRLRRVAPALALWQGLYAFLGTPLVARDAPEAAADLLAELAKLAGRRLLLAGRVHGEGELAAAFAGASPGRHVLAERETYDRALLVRRPDGDYYAHMRPHRRRELQRQRRRLAEELGAELECADRAEDPQAVERFLALERSGWKGRARTALGYGDADTAFFAEVCARVRAAGRLQLLELRAGERVVAMKCNLLAAPGSFAFKIAMDEAYAKFSPGVLLEQDNVTRFHESGLEWMDSCADPCNEMINRLWEPRRQLARSLYRRRGLGGRAMMTALQGIAAIRGTQS